MGDLLTIKARKNSIESISNMMHAKSHTYICIFLIQKYQNQDSITNNNLFTTKEEDGGCIHLV